MMCDGYYMIDNEKQFLSSLPNKPGIYQMFDAGGQVLYVGKAKNLKKRVSSYFRAANHPKTKIFMAQVENIEIIITPSENAALLLESNLIKAKKPRYNILFKDDKSFPYLLLSRHDFPRLSIHRGAINKVYGKYFGQFPDALAVNFILNLLQKIFKIRVCKDSFMRNRSRPCMLYQIKLCSAPCVGYVDKVVYASQVELVEQFLCNKSDYVVKKLTKLMDMSATKLDYEQAVNYRDQIANIRKVQAKQVITEASGNYDVIALVVKNNEVCINVLFIRNGLVLGNKACFPKIYNFTLSPGEILSAFITHYYLQNENNTIIPEKILLNIKLPQRLDIVKIFREKFGRRITVSDRVQGAQKQLIAMAEVNAANALKNHHTSSINYAQCLLDFKKILNLLSVPQRIECFDVSHTMGEAQVASCVVFNESGPSKKDYRRFNIKNVRAGDDYGALRDALLRRYGNLENLPDVIMVDGGLGQLGVASQVLQMLNMQKVKLIAVAKGKDRKPGLEKIYIYGRKDPLILSPQSQVLHFIQQIRDEAHHFAITSHRKQMRKSRHKSVLENISGVGKSKRVALLKYFGGLAELQSAGADDLAKVNGIGSGLAKRIYDRLHA
ncbi:MAG TPA: excinuclease ABC subunit C [Coxiellaceae bacterium]|nr:excinuclease ABC subunit C [Coxiellaceae bacterium]